MTFYRSGPRERLVETTTHFHGRQLIGEGDIKVVRTELLNNLLHQLRDCFCDASEEVLRASTVGSFKLWPDKLIQGMENLRRWQCENTFEFFFFFAF